MAHMTSPAANAPVLAKFVTIGDSARPPQTGKPGPSGAPGDPRYQRSGEESTTNSQAEPIMTFGRRDSDTIQPARGDVLAISEVRKVCFSRPLPDPSNARVVQ